MVWFELWLGLTTLMLLRSALSGGIISTIAGSGSTTYNGDSIPATDASLYVPQAVAVDLSG